MKKPFILGDTFFPSLEENVIWDGDIKRVRNYYQNKPTRIKKFLLATRFGWIDQQLTENGNNIEIGSGSGLASFFIKKKMLLTDIIEHDWIERKLDANNLDLEEDSVDAFVLTHCIHHFADPIKFFRDAYECLKSNGKIIIHDPNPSLLLRILSKITKHEGWSYECNPFSANPICNDPKDIWSANLAITELLFHDHSLFEKELGGYQIIQDDFSECLVWTLSGGVNVQSIDIDFPKWFIKIIYSIDKLLIKIPTIFALSRRIVIQKRT